MADPTVTVDMSFLEPWPKTTDSESPYLRHITSERFPSTNFKNVVHRVDVTDARAIMNSFSLDKNGFAFRRAEPLPNTVIDAIRAGPEGKSVVENEVFGEVEGLVKSWTGAKKVVAFDYGYRRRDPGIDMSGGKNAYARGQPATVVHCDQSAWGARRRVEKHTGSEAAELLQGRCQIINIWRPLTGPVRDWPLAVMDASTISTSHIHPTNLYSKERECQGQTVGVNYDKHQRWYFLSGQTPSEVTLVKIWDSEGEKGDGVASMCAHCAFQHPEAASATVPRESIEVRCLVF